MNDNQPPQDVPQPQRKLGLRDYIVILILIVLAVLVVITLLTPTPVGIFSNIVNAL